MTSNIYIQICKATSDKIKLNSFSVNKHCACRGPVPFRALVYLVERGCPCSTSPVCLLYIPTQRTYDAIITSSLRQNDVATSFWRNDDVIITSRAHCVNIGSWFRGAFCFDYIMSSWEINVIYLPIFFRVDQLTVSKLGQSQTTDTKPKREPCIYFLGCAVFTVNKCASFTGFQ